MNMAELRVNIWGLFFSCFITLSVTEDGTEFGSKMEALWVPRKSEEIKFVNLSFLKQYWGGALWDNLSGISEIKCYGKGIYIYRNSLNINKLIYIH